MGGRAARILHVLSAILDLRHRLRRGAFGIPDVDGIHDRIAARIVVEYHFDRRVIKQPALAPSPQPRPAPTVRALPAELAAQRGPFWMPIRGPNPTPIDSTPLQSLIG